MFETALKEDDSVRTVSGKTTALRIGLLGCGKVGSALAALCEAERGLFNRFGLEPAIHVVLVRDPSRPRENLPSSAILTTDPDEFFDAGEIDVLVEALGGVAPAFALVERALQRGIPVVTANKSLIAGCGHELRRTAQRFGTTLRCEACVIAGLPFLDGLQRRPLLQRVERVVGILNGTSNFVLSMMDSRGASLGEALKIARARGFAEPRSESDISGLDAAEKLVIVLRRLGVGNVSVEDIERVAIDAVTPQLLSQARALGGTIKPVAFANLTCGRIEAFVGPAFVENASPLAAIRDEQNILRLYGSRIGELSFAGPGAGPEVTAATILDDVVATWLSSPSIGELELRSTADTRSVGGPPHTPWFVRVCLSENPPAPTALCERLASHGIWLRRSLPFEQCPAGEAFGAITQPCARELLVQAFGELRSESGCVWDAIRVVEG